MASNCATVTGRACRPAPRQVIDVGCWSGSSAPSARRVGTPRPWRWRRASALASWATNTGCSRCWRWRNRPDDALAALDEWQARPGATLMTIVRLRVRALREAKRFDEMESAIAELHALAPADPAPAVYGVVQRAMAGREAATDAGLKDYLFRFGGGQANVMLLAEPLARKSDRRRSVARGDRGRRRPARRPTQPIPTSCSTGADPGAARRLGSKASRRTLAGVETADGGAGAPRGRPGAPLAPVDAKPHRCGGHARRGGATVAAGVFARPPVADGDLPARRSSRWLTGGALGAGTRGDCGGD